MIEQNLCRNESTNLYYFCLWLKVFTIISYCLDVKGESFGPYVVFALNIVYFCLTIYDFYTVMPFGSIIKSKMYLSALCTSFFFVIIGPVHLLFNLLTSNEFICWALFIIPLLIKLLFFIYDKKMHFLFFDVFSTINK